jgi:hypothetical protein
MYFRLIAEADAILSGSGWAGAGLLGLVLGWLLLKGLPDKDKQIKELIDTFLTEVKDARKESVESIAKERQQRHEERNQTHADGLRMATLLTENTQQTQALAQEVRVLASMISTLAKKVDPK